MSEYLKEGQWIARVALIDPKKERQKCPNCGSVGQLRTELNYEEKEVIACRDCSCEFLPKRRWFFWKGFLVTHGIPF